MSERRPTGRQRQAVYDRAQGVCEYCLSPAAYSSDYFSIEHIYPRALGGTNQLSNLALACQGCNSHKFTHIEALDPMDGRPTPLYHPRQDRWGTHFYWDEDFTLMIGRTPIGRATIANLYLNREGAVNLRIILRIAKRRPPHWQ